MNGGTHMKIAALSYAIGSTVPAFTSLPFGKERPGLTVAGLAVAAVAGLLADADCHNSKINHMNPVTGVANGTIDLVEGLLTTAINLIFTIGIGAWILFNSQYVIRLVSKLGLTHNYAIIITYGTAAMFIMLGLSMKKGVSVLRSIPIIGSIYGGIIGLIRESGNFFKRAAAVIIYAGSGLWIMRYNYLYVQDGYLYLIGSLLIGIAIFPHRSFLHSIEGFGMFTIAAWYLGSKTGQVWLIQPFVIGYFSHLYLTDILTNEGVPLSVIPMILEKTGLDSVFKKFWPYRLIDKVLSIRLKLPLMSTGSAWGNVFEGCYALLFFVIAVISFINYNGSINLI